MKRANRALPALVTFICVALLAGQNAWSQVNVWTHRYDNARTGANLAETVLNTSNVNSSQFGKLFSYAVDADIYAQPLVIQNVTIPGKGTHNVVYVATNNNSVYAFDADNNLGANGLPLWQASFNGPGVTPIPATDIYSANSIRTPGPIGIMGTPVIDQATGTLYVVARTKENGVSYVQRLHALDISTGSEKFGGPVLIQASVPGTGYDSVGGVVTFNPKTQNQRAGLALANGNVYIMWSSYADIDPYHGWVMAYNASTLQQVGAFLDTPDGQKGGIWQSGQPPAVDASGNVFLATGNGDFNGTRNFGQSIVKLTPNLSSVSDYFAPGNWALLNSDDLDLGSSGVFLLPGTNYATGAGKDGHMYVVDRANMGHSQSGNGQIVQNFQVTTGGNIHGAPAYWNGPAGPRIYVWGEMDYLKSYAFTGSLFNTTPVSQSTFPAPTGMPGGFLTVSANGSQAGSGILWASIPYAEDANDAVVSGVLRAFDASDLTRELWNTRMVPARDDLGNFAKFVPPTVANGRVYLSSFSNRLLVYGLLASMPPPSGGAIVGSGVASAATVDLSATGTSDWAHWPGYDGKSTGNLQITDFTYLGAPDSTYLNDLRTLTWNDGTPNVCGASTSGVTITGTGNGFLINAPADTTDRTLTVYVGGTNSRGMLTAHLSDSSAPDFVDTGFSSTGQYDAVYTLTYHAATIGQMTVAWTQFAGGGNVTLQGATLAGSSGTAPPPGCVWVEDAVPAGGRIGFNGGDAWTWVSSNPTPFSGTLAHQSAVAAGSHQHYFFQATRVLPVVVGDTLFTYVYLDPANAPSEVMLEFYDSTGSWEHRAYWGSNLINGGVDGTVSRRNMGALPAAGQWVQVSVPASLVGLEGSTLTGMAYSLYGGRATWDRSGKVTTGTTTFQVTGTVTVNSVALSGVTFGVAGGASCTTSDASGQYTCTVPQGWSGTVTPSLAGYTFTPTSRSYTNVAANQTAQNYTATAVTTFQVSGTVTLNSAGLSGVGFTATNGVSCTTSNASGQYSCTVPQGWTGTVTPSLVGYTFAPTSRSYSNVVANQTAQDYVAAAGTVTVWVEDALPAGATAAGDVEGWNWVSSNPAPFSGALAHQSTVASGEHQHFFYNATATLAVAVGDTLFSYVYLDPANPPSEVMLQWNDGTWEHRAYWGANQITWGTNGTTSRQSMGALPPMGQWVLLAVPAAQVGLEGHTLNGMAFTLVGGRATWDYAGKSAAGAPTYQVTGTVTLNAAALAGVSFAATAGANCTTSNASGQYTCTVPQGWSGTVTPSLAGYTFAPASRSYSNVLANQTTQDYAATAITYQLTGTATLNAAALAGVTFTATGGPTCTTSNASGQYSCTVPQGWSGTVTPSLSGYTFAPASRSYSNVVANQTAQDYAATAITYQVTGTVTLNATALAGVSFAAAAGGNCTTSDASGQYTCTVPQGWSGTVTPSLAGYTFTPTSRSYTNVAANQTAQNYTATAVTTFQVSGTVTLNSAGLSGVGFTATNGVSCTTSNASGQYSCTVPQGWTGTVTPSLVGYTFAPTSRSYSNVVANQTAQDYVAAAGTVTVWVEDALPAGATAAGDVEGWNWVSSNPAPFSGALAHQSTVASGEHQHFFYNATATLAVAVGDTLFSYVYLDPANPPSEVMLQWNDGTWEHRAYWGANQITWGTNGTTSRQSMGALPPMGQWVLLAVPAAQVGLEGHTLNGMAFTLVGGRATWDYAGKATTTQVSGTVTLNGAALSGVSLAATGGVNCTTSDATGHYVCAVLPGWSGSVTPSLVGYSFTPASRSYNSVTVSQNAQDYAASAANVWVDDAVPAGAAQLGSGDTWNWISINPTPFSGALAHQSAVLAGMHQHYFLGATATLSVGVGDTLFAYVYLDPANPPHEVMLQWNDGSWEHRAFWGADLIAWGTSGTTSRRNMGALPATGQWVKLVVPAAQVGLEGATVNGMAYTLYDGRATWDYAGK